jgi:hypothetical protein
MKNLISMTDFVLEYYGIYDPIFYATFLKQPLEKWMFFPCDEDGNVLEEPLKRDYNSVNINNSYYKKYQQAKERCLFEGLEYNFFPNGTIRCYNSEKELSKMYSIVFNKNGIIENKTDIESISKYPIQLTATAQKKLS